MKKFIYSLLFIMVWGTSFSQCDIDVPTYVINLSSNPDTTWVLYEEDALNRDGYCCGASGSDNCIRFEITLNENAAGIYFNYDGAPSYGSLAWQLDCGPEYSLRDTICVSDPGPFTLSFCKPGSDNGNYTLISVAKPTFPDDQTVPLNCVQPVEVLGVTGNSITWESISPGAPGDYNHLMSCVDCLEPIFTPDPAGPLEVEYRVCGYPILDYCVGNLLFCDTVKFTILDSLKLNVSPNNPAFCVEGDITLTASATGGDGNYNFIWYDGSLNVVGTGPTLYVDTPGNYTAEVRDGNYSPGYCDDFLKTVAVVQTTPPTVNAGEDQVLCGDNPIASLSGTINNASGGIWSGGSGIYTPSTTDLAMTYTPTTSEIASGSVILTLQSTGPGSGCPNKSDEIELFFLDTIQSTLVDVNMMCNNGTEIIDPSLTGGMAPYNYSWSDGSSNSTAEFGIGTHCLSVIDANGCTLSECFTISAPTQLLVSMSSSPVTTMGGADGTATATPSGGMAPYSYNWSNGGNTPSISGLVYGIYTVTVTDANGCEQVGSVVVNNPLCNGFYVNTSSTAVGCFGENTGTVTVTPVNGTGPFNYVWNDPLTQSTATATNLYQGVYEVIVTDDNGCLATNTASVTEPTALINAFTSSDATTQGGDDGSAQVNVSGGTAPYGLLWSNLETTPTINDLSAGWYNVSITDDNGCNILDSVYINEPPCNTFNLIVGTTSPLCAGDETADALLTIANGVGPYDIDWNTGETDVMSINNKGAGTYFVEVIDARGCYAFQSFGISEPSPLVIGLNATPSTCAGSNNGTIDMSIVGGTFPYYYYNWSNGAATEDIINLSPGSYSIEVTDENGCIANASTNLIDPPALDLTYSVTDVTCFEGTDGSINVSPTGGTPPYAFDWSNGATTEDLTGVDFGGYILTLTDANNCNYGSPITINVNEPEVVMAAAIDVDCPIPGSNLAEVHVTPTGGSGTFSVSFDGGTTFLPSGDFIESIATGQGHDIIIQDVNGCQSMSNHIDINANVTIDSVDFDKCYVAGQLDETISVNISGGSGSYQASSDNGFTYNGLNNLDLIVGIDNTYSIVAMDDLGCISVAYPIVLPSILDYTISVTTDYNGQAISCSGVKDGELLAEGIGGTGPYSYSWDNGPLTAINSGIGAGTYTVTVTDANGCTISGSETLIEPDPVTIDVLSDIVIDCPVAGESEAMVHLAPSGGVGNFSISFDGGSTFGAMNVYDFSMPIGSSYNIVVADENGCNSTPGMITLNPSLIIDDIDFNPCYTVGQTDEEIQVNISGGSGTYMISVDNGVSYGSLNDLDEILLIDASYTVVAQDDDGCLSLPMNITLPPVFDNSMTVESDYNGEAISCYGMSDGSVAANPTGGTGPYTYSWNNAETTQLITGVNAGTYVVTINDANDCQLIGSISISNPQILSSTTSVASNYNGEDVSCHGVADGMATVVPTGGVSPYDIEWDNGQTSLSCLGIGAGVYSVNIIDANGCTTSNSITINEPDTLDIATSIVDVSCNGGNDGAIDATISGGVNPYSFQWSNGPTTEDVSLLSAGTYSVIVTDENGCVYELDELVVDPTAIELSTIASAVSCYSLADGSVDLNAIGGTPPYSFDWSNGESSEDISSLLAGSYTVVVTDDNGCFTDITTTVIQPDSLELSANVTNASCFEFQNGLIDLSAIGGVQPYSYSWSNGNNQEDNYDLGAGSYDVVLTDANGCNQFGTYFVTEPELLVVELNSPLNFHNHNIGLFGGNDGSIDSEVTGGTEPYTYDWSNGEETASIANLTAGEYSVLVIDELGCEASAEIRLIEPLELEMPTAFSPNNDGDNDLFDIHGIEAYPDNKLIITNRWGNIVYEEKGYSNTWNGVNQNGQALPDGVYFVILEINGAEITKDNYVHIKRF